MWSKADRHGSISSNNNVRLPTESHADTRRSRRLFSKQGTDGLPLASQLPKSNTKSVPKSLHREITNSAKQSSQHTAKRGHILPIQSLPVTTAANKRPSDSSGKEIATKCGKFTTASKSPQGTVSSDGDVAAVVTPNDSSGSTSGIVKKKGPPARGLIWLAEQQRKQRYSVNSLDAMSDRESDSDYEPSEHSSENDDSSDCEPTDSDNDTCPLHIDNVDQSEDDVQDDSARMDEWHDVRGLQKQFIWVESESIQSNVPGEMHKVVDFFELFCDREVVTETNRCAQQTL